ncbi:MAG: hypothetical protein ACLRSV_04470 [Oscillospiraceae bacterium]
MPVACRNRRGFSAEKGSQPLRQLVANYAGILCHRACQLDCNLAAGEHHVNDLLGGFAVSYVDGESPLLKGKILLWSSHRGFCNEILDV